MKDIRYIHKWGGYRSNSEPTNIDTGMRGILLPPSKNMKFMREGVVMTRYGMSKIMDTFNSNVYSAWVWVNSRGKKFNLFASNNAVYVIYNGAIHKLADVARNDIDYTSWWHHNDKRDLLLFVDGTDGVFYWRGSITNIATGVNNSDIIDITDNTFDVALLPGDPIYINGTEYSVAEITGETQIRISQTITASQGDVIIGKTIKLTTFSYSAILDTSIGKQDFDNVNLTDTLGFTFDSILTVNNNVYYGSRNNRRVFISKNNIWYDFRFSTPRTEGEGDTFVLNNPVTAFIDDASHGRVVASCGTDEMYEIKQQQLATSTAITYFTSVRLLRSGVNAGILNNKSSTGIKYSFAFLTHANEVDSLGRVEQLDTTTSVPLSDDIRLDLEQIDSTNAVLFYFNNSLYVSFPKERLVYEYDFTQAIWNTPYSMYITAFTIYNNKLAGYTDNGVLAYLFDGEDDLGNPIESELVLDYSTFGKRFHKKQFDLLAFDGYINKAGDLEAEILFDFDGSTERPIYRMRDERISQLIKYVPNTYGGLGTVRYGETRLGIGFELNSDNNIGIDNKFKWFIPTDVIDFYEMQVRVKSATDNTRFALVAYGTNTRLSNNNAHFSLD